jgi:hypothetical protein
MDHVVPLGKEDTYGVGGPCFIPRKRDMKLNTVYVLRESGVGQHYKVTAAVALPKLNPQIMLLQLGLDIVCAATW